MKCGYSTILTIFIPNYLIFWLVLWIFPMTFYFLLFMSKQICADEPYLSVWIKSQSPSHCPLPTQGSHLLSLFPEGDIFFFLLLFSSQSLSHPAQTAPLFAADSKQCGPGLTPPSPGLAVHRGVAWTRASLHWGTFWGFPFLQLHTQSAGDSRLTLEQLAFLLCSLRTRGDRNCWDLPEGMSPENTGVGAISLPAWAWVPAHWTPRDARERLAPAWEPWGHRGRLKTLVWGCPSPALWPGSSLHAFCSCTVGARCPSCYSRLTLFPVPGHRHFPGWLPCRQKAGAHPLVHSTCPEPAEDGPGGGWAGPQPVARRF